jgi:hypothetical protein
VRTTTTTIVTNLAATREVGKMLGLADNMLSIARMAAPTLCGALMQVSGVSELVCVEREWSGAEPCVYRRATHDGCMYGCTHAIRLELELILSGKSSLSPGKR